MKTLLIKLNIIFIGMISILLMLAGQAAGQGWQTNFVSPNNVQNINANNNNYVRVLATEDGGGLTIGLNVVSAFDSYLSIRKVDIDGTLQWTKQYNGGSNYNAPYDAIPALDGGYLIAAFTHFNISSLSTYVLKID